MSFYSHGKLLISGEYLVTQGATALAIPVRFGQTLDVRATPGGAPIRWETCIRGEKWFEASFDPSSLKPVYHTSEASARFIAALLRHVRAAQPGLFSGKSYELAANLEFDPRWGLGSSSSLISNLASWSGLDPYLLNRKITAGSGYDIACATASQPILFHTSRGKAFIEETPFSPPFCHRIFFVYTGRKQDTAEALADFRKNRKRYSYEVRLVSGISKHMAVAANLKDFEFYMSEHEQIMASVLRRKRIKEEYFKDFPGEMKSLGAWGGDFLMVTWEGTRRELEDYFSRHRMEPVFSLPELALQNDPAE
ncbi:MAG: hypothetical protein JW861_08295 [Bacteroidales bacterium]|nr:hypothetical protein [Bacteroidales bacterium]